MVFVVWRLLRVCRLSLRVVCCVLLACCVCVACGMWFAGYCVLFVGCCCCVLRVVVRCLLCVGCCLLFVDVCCLLCVVSLFVVSCLLLSDERCVLFVAYR